MNKLILKFSRLKFKPELIVLILGLTAVLYSQWSSLNNDYIINDDYNQHLFWMHQYQDNELFQNDIYTIYAKNYQPWGFLFICYILSFFFSPFVFSKILPVILHVISCLYLFKLVKRIKGNFAGFLALLIFLTTPTFVSSGAFPRTFGFPLMFSFLYYLISKKYSKVALILILECLFYPSIFLTSSITTCLSILKAKKGLSFKNLFKKIKFLLLGLTICLSIISGKYLFSNNPSLGKVATRKDMTRNIAFYKYGRAPVLPTPPMNEELFRNTSMSTPLPQVFERFLLTADLPEDTRRWFPIAVISILFISLFVDIFRKKQFIPLELLFLFISGIAMFKIADIFIFKLHLPARYLEYTFPIICLIFISVSLTLLIEKIKIPQVKLAARTTLVILISLNITLTKAAGLSDFSKYKNLCEFLKTLPKNTLIAAPPVLGDMISTFASRKVWLKYELTHPTFDRYWESMKQRTTVFFTAYYSNNPVFIYNFCDELEIDYIVVDTKYYTDYLRTNVFYFEPFNGFIQDMLKKKNKKGFFLPTVSDKNKLFQEDNVFVIHKDTLLKKQ